MNFLISHIKEPLRRSLYQHQLLKRIYILIRNSINLFISILIFPLTLTILIVIILIRPIIHIRVGRLRNDKIGHLSLEFELYLLEKKLEKKRKFDIFFKEKIVCNKTLYNLRKKQLIVFPKFILKDSFFLFNFFGLKDLFCANRKFGDEDTNYLIDKSKPTITLKKEILNKNLEKLYKNGLKKNQKIVCIHIRDSAFRGYSDFTDYKNTYDYKNYYKTIKFLLKKKYYVVRTGRKSFHKFKIKDSNFLDYPFSKVQSDDMDMVLANKCYFGISTGSGYDGVIRMFRNPVLFVNFIPPGYFPSYGKKNMVIFKHMNINKSFVSFKKLIDTGLFFNCDGRNFSNHKITFKENSTDEIYSALRDFLKFIKSNFKQKQIHKEKIKQIFYNKVKNQYKYSKHKKINASISNSYLKKNRRLFD